VLVATDPLKLVVPRKSINSAYVYKVPRLILKENSFRTFFTEMPYVYLSRGIESVSELYGQRLYTGIHKAKDVPVLN
jgi:hypothetical protein